MNRTHVTVHRSLFAYRRKVVIGRQVLYRRLESIDWDSVALGMWIKAQLFADIPPHSPSDMIGAKAGIMECI